MKMTLVMWRLGICGVAAVAASAIVAGCGGGGYGGSTMYGGGAPPPPAPSPSPGPVVHINFFGPANGTITDATFGTVSGFTQQAHAQVLAFAPAEQITITNNDTVPHTLNVFSAYPTPGPQSTSAVPNGGVLAPGYQSGVLQPGQTTSVLTVTNAVGNLFIICGIHFSSGMQDGIVINVSATPGPEATPNPTSSGGCHGYGC